MTYTSMTQSEVTTVHQHSASAQAAPACWCARFPHRILSKRGRTGKGWTSSPSHCSRHNRLPPCASSIETDSCPLHEGKDLSSVHSQHRQQKIWSGLGPADQTPPTPMPVAAVGTSYRKPSTNLHSLHQPAVSPGRPTDPWPYSGVDASVQVK